MNDFFGLMFFSNEISNFQSSPKCGEADVDSYLELKTEIDQSRGKYLLPGLLVDQPWTDTEYSSFLLGSIYLGRILLV